MTNAIVQKRIEDSEYADAHAAYVQAKHAYLTAWLEHRKTLLTYENIKSQHVLAVDSARDNAGKALFANEASRKAETTLRINADSITEDLIDAELRLKETEDAAKAAGRAYHALTTGVQFSTDEDSE